MYVAVVVSLLLTGACMTQQLDFSRSVAFSPVKKGQPFLAEVETTLSSRLPNGEIKRESTKGAVFRDSSGRYREEFSIRDATGRAMHFAVIRNPIEGLAYTLNVTERTLLDVIELQRDDAEKEAGQGNYSPADDAAKTDVSTKYIEGVLCHRYYSTQPNGDTLEVWFSADLGEAVIETIVSGSTEKVVRLSKIQRTEPDPALFSVPSDYKRSS